MLSEWEDDTPECRNEHQHLPDSSSLDGDFGDLVTAEGPEDGSVDLPDGPPEEVDTSWFEADDGLLQETDEPTDVSAVTEAPGVGDLARRFVSDMGKSIATAAIWQATAAIADVLAPGSRVILEAAHYSASTLSALASLNAGRGFTMPIQVADLGQNFSIDLQFRQCEEHPPPFPSIEPDVSWNLTDIPVPSWLQVDGAGPHRFVKVVADEPADPPASRGYDIVTLARLAAERARATGNAGSESWSPLVIAYLRPQMQAGLLVVQPTADVQPYAPLWFETLMPTDLAEALEARRKNRRRR